MALYKLRTTVVTVTTAGTAVPISATSKLVSNLVIYANDSNINNIYVGDSTVDNTTGMPLKPELSLEVELPTDANGKMIEIDLNQIYIDSDTNGNTSVVTYTERG